MSFNARNYAGGKKKQTLCQNTQLVTGGTMANSREWINNLCWGLLLLFCTQNKSSWSRWEPLAKAHPMDHLCQLSDALNPICFLGQSFWDRSSGVLLHPCNDTLPQSHGPTGSQHTASWAKQCLRTTAPSCLWKRASNATTQGHKDKKTPNSLFSSYSYIISDISRKETQTFMHLI